MRNIREWKDRDMPSSNADYTSLLDDWQEDIDKLEDENQRLDLELNAAYEKIQARSTPVWGNCRRGCSPSYIDSDGFCSPACKLGAPRGQYVTIAEVA